MKKRLIALSLLTTLGCVLRGGGTTPTEDRLWATRITCELQTAGPASLPALYWQQGTSPLLSLDQYRSGRAVDADTNVTAVLRLAPTATNLAAWVSVTNYATVGNGYLIQMPSVGTNTTASGAWWYTAYFIRGTAVYWTGSGRVTITATTSTGDDGLVWQEILPPGSCLTWEEITGKPSTFPPSAHTHTYTDITDPPWLTSFTEQDVTALQALSDYAETNRVVRWWNGGGNMFVTLEDGVGSVWEIVPATTNLMIELMEGFSGAEKENPSWTNYSFPFNDSSGWIGVIEETHYKIWYGNPLVTWISSDLTLPATLEAYPGGTYGGIAVVSIESFENYQTNLVYTFATSQQVETVSDNLGIHTNNEAIHLSTEQVDKIANAVTNEQDLAALRAYHYGSPDIVESPAEWFVFDGAGTITAFNWEAGRENVVIPWAIGGVPVTGIGTAAFSDCASLTSVTIPNSVTSIGASAFYFCTSLTSITIPNTVTSIGNYAFYYCTDLTSVTIGNSVTSIGSAAFGDCTALTSLYFDGNAPTIGSSIFFGLPDNQVTNYVTNPTATGWGDELGGMPVVRMDLYGDKIYQAGELVATTGHVAQAIAAIPEPDLSDRPTFAQMAATNALAYKAWTGTVTPADGTATLHYAHGNMPVLVTDAPCVLTLDPTGYGTAGVSRVSLSYYTGTNSFTFATNFVSYATTPTVDTNGWNSLLIRRVSNGAWKGVGL